MKTVTRLAILAVLLGGWIVLGVVGCDDSSGIQGPADDQTMASMESSDDGPSASGPFTTLTIADLDARLKMNDAQRVQMQKALSELQDARRDRWGRREGGGRHGRGDHHGRGGRVERIEHDFDSSEPPIVQFLEDASKILTPDQFREMAVLAGEQRQARIQRRGGHGPAGDGPMDMFDSFGPRAARALGLTEQQREQLKPIVKSHASEVRAVREQVRSGALTRDQAQQQIRTIRLKMREEARAVLTTEQWEKAKAFRVERTANRIDRRLANMEDHLTRRAEFLARVLGLDAGQAEQVRGFVLGTIPARQELLGQLRAGAIEPEDVTARVRAIEEALAGQIVALLTPEQEARWDALRDLMPRQGF